MTSTKNKSRRLLPVLLVLLLLGLNLLAYKTTKSYFNRNNVQEVEELTTFEQGEQNSFKLLSWTFELFKSFRNTQ
jgi:hypothetical protein